MESDSINKSTIFLLLHKNKSQLLKYGVKQLGLFGSFVRNQQNENSDVDILVEFDEGKKNYKNFLELAYFLEGIFGRKVDLLTPQSLNKYIAPYILKETKYVF